MNLDKPEPNETSRQIEWDDKNVIAKYECPLDKNVPNKVFAVIKRAYSKLGYSPPYLIVSRDICVNLYESKKLQFSTSKAVLFMGVQVICNSDLPDGTITPVLHPEDEILFGTELRQGDS